MVRIGDALCILTLLDWRIMNENIFTKPERPFLLLAEDNEHSISCHWLESEEELQEAALELKDGGRRIIDAIEIGNCRNVEIKPKYLVDDFIEEINSAYDKANELKFDSIVLTIDTDTDETYHINDTSDGFQCDEFDYYFEDLDSIAEALFVEKVIGKPIEIRIE